MNNTDKVVDMAYNETIDFLLSKESWKGENGSLISYGLLNAVFHIIFKHCPSKEIAMELIIMSLSNFKEIHNA